VKKQTVIFKIIFFSFVGVMQAGITLFHQDTHGGYDQQYGDFYKRRAEQELQAQQQQQDAFASLYQALQIDETVTSRQSLNLHGINLSNNTTDSLPERREKAEKFFTPLESLIDLDLSNTHLLELDTSILHPLLQSLSKNKERIINISQNDLQNLDLDAISTLIALLEPRSKQIIISQEEYEQLNEEVKVFIDVFKNQDFIVVQ